MSTEHTLLTVGRALRNPAVSGFVRACVRAGYHEFFPDLAPQVDRLVDEAFDQLEASQRSAADPARLVAVVTGLLRDTFHKADPGFWFNARYHDYKTRLKPETDFQQLRALLRGPRILDYGCGSGYLAARLARGGYQVFTTDVLDYRYAEARHLPFVQMTTPTEVAYPDDSADTALIQAVLHHIDSADLAPVLERLSRIARQLVIKEDAYGLPPDLPGLAETLAAQPLLQAFVALPLATQAEALALIDYYANAVAQGLPEMNMPFEFKTVPEWQRRLEASGLRVARTVVAGFERGRLHKSCHVWFVAERA